MSSTIQRIPFGRTGHLSTRVIFGAAALGSVTQKEADATLDLLLKHGINHIDTAASYGESELRIGPWMKRGLRNQFFLATKTGERSYQKAYDSIRQSLEKMHVDKIDLIQLHCLIDDDEWDEAMGPDGALKACLQAQREGLVTYIGVTGHELRVPRMHLRSVKHYDFDTVLLPYNYVLSRIPQYMADFDALVADCTAHKRGIQTIKSITAAPWGDNQRSAATWYRPLTEQADIDKAVAWVLSRDGIFLNSVGDIHVLPKVLLAAEHYFSGAAPTPTEDSMNALLAEREMSSLFV